MKTSSKYLFAIVVLLWLPTFGSGCQPDSNSPEGLLQRADARQAMALANDWKWTNTEIKSHVTTREVVFELPNGKEKKVALPANEMLVAIAPFINQTHQ